MHADQGMREVALGVGYQTSHLEAVQSTSDEAGEGVWRIASLPAARASLPLG